MKIILFSFVSCIVCFCLNAQPGTLDYSFGDKGKVVSKTYEGTVYAGLEQPDGKIVVAGVGGYYTNENVLIAGFSIYRYNSDGTLDNSFGDSGRSVNSMGAPGFAKLIYSIALQPDGKIVAAGQYAESGDDSRIAVMRFNADGSIDEGFGNEGLTVTALSNYYDIVRDMALLPDGRIVVTGDLTAGINDNYRSFIVCYTPEGFLDKKFGNKGVAIIELDKVMDINAIAITAENKIIVGGNYKLSSVKNILLRYNNDGSIDRSFGNNGLAELPFEKTVLNSHVKDITITADNKIVTAGDVYFNSGTTAIAVSRFTENGMPDSSFGTNAYSINKYKDGDSYANAMAIQDNGKIIAGGYFLKGEKAAFTVTRFTDKGSIDSSFGDNGIQNTSFTGDDVAYALTLQKDGKIVLAGSSFDYSSYKWLTQLARYNGDEAQQQPPITRIKRWLRKHGFTWENWPGNNIAAYSVQRSSNGINWTTIFSRRATGNLPNGQAGNQRPIANGNYEDPAPLSGTNYYRLQTTSTDGAVAYSNVIAITNDYASVVRISPNPAKNNLRIEGLPAGRHGLSSGKSKLTVVDLAGNIKLQAVANSKTYNLNIASLKAGNYLLKIEKNGEVLAKKFIKE